jgi:aspartate aminotransferase
VHTRAELETVAGLLDTSDTLVLADEAYSDLVYTDKPFVSALDVPSLAARTLYCQTFSKAHAMTGWRIGYLAGPRDVIGAAARVHATIAGPLNAATQRAALAAADSTSGAVQRMRQEYRQRRDLMVSGLQSIDGLQLAVPDGAFYAFPRYEHALPATEMVAHLRLNGVAVRPGSEFGAAGERHLRLSFAADRDAITIGIDRMKAALTHSDPEAQR